MDDEELYKAFEPTQHTILGYVSDMWRSRNDLDEDLNANIIPLSVRNNDRWMPSSSTLVKRISRFFGDSVFAYKLTKSLPGLTKYSLLEFHVREASPNKGSKYSVDYDYEVKSVSLPYVLVTDYSSFSDQIESSFFNPDSVVLQVDKDISGKCYLQNRGDKNSLILGPFKVSKQIDGYKMLPAIGKEIYSTQIFRSDFADYTVVLPDGYERLLNEKDFNSLKSKPIDCMTSKQLSDWGKSLINSTEGIDSETINNTLNLLKADAFDDHMAKIRLNRISNDFNWISEIIGDLEKQKTRIINQYIDNHPELKKEAEDRVISELEGFEETRSKYIDAIEKAKIQLEEKQEQLKSKQNEYDSLESSVNEKRGQLEAELTGVKEEHDKIKREISQLKEKRDLLEVQIEDRSGLKYHVIDDSERKSFSELCAESDIEISVGNELKRNAKRLGIEGELRHSLGEDYSFLNCQAMFVPNMSWVYVYGILLGKTKIASIYPEYDWLHYRDFKDAGLEKIWIDASIDSSYTYILYIDGLNIVTPESGLRSLLDVIEGKSLALANTGRKIPRNLRIMVSLLPSVSDNPDDRLGLHLRPEKFVKWGAVSEPNDKTIYDIHNVHASNLISFDPEDIKLPTHEVDNSLWAEKKEKYFAF